MFAEKVRDDCACRFLNRTLNIYLKRKTRWQGACQIEKGNDEGDTGAFNS